MASSSSRLVGVVLLAAALACTLPAASRAQLQVGFYDYSCPDAEDIIRQAVAAAFAKDAGIAAGLIRLHFHDCFVRGCDASVLLISPNGTAERDAFPNFPSLRGFEVIDAAKAAVEQCCPGTVSCADIIAFAARDSVGLTGNLFYDVPAGRRDGTVSIDKEANAHLPPPTATAAQLADKFFAAKNLTLDDMVILSGAHTVGRSFCNSFFRRVWNGTTPIVDDGLDPSYAATLRALCPPDTNRTTPITTPMDPDTPATLDNNYYKLLPKGKGLFFSDNQLRVNTTMNALVTTFAADELLWKLRFAEAMVKMGQIEVKTGGSGQIRLSCSAVNPSSSSPVVELHGDHEDDDAGVATS